MNKRREANYDLLRVLCALAVVIIHVSGVYKKAYTGAEYFGQLYQEHIVVTLLYNTLSYFAVPCFVMLSGAFLLDDERNANYRFFYKKAISKLGIPMVLFSILYFLYAEATAGVKILLMDASPLELLIPLRDWIQGEPYYHMWYLYTMAGIYVLVPVILNVKKTVGEKVFAKITVIIFLLSVISGWTSWVDMHWNIAKVICYTGYFMLGYLIRKKCMDRKQNGIGFLFVVLGILTGLVLTYIQYLHTLMGIAAEDEKYTLVGNFNPLIVLASVLIFAGFSKIQINWNLDKIAAQTFYIYLFHAGIWSVFTQIVFRIGVSADSRVVIPVNVVLVFVLSYVCAVIYAKVWKKLDSKCAITDKICKLLRLK